MKLAQNLLSDLRCLLAQRLGLLVLAPLAIQNCQAVYCCSHSQAALAQCLLGNGQSITEQLSSLLVPVLVPTDQRQGVQHSGHIGVVGAQYLLQILQHLLTEWHGHLSAALPGTRSPGDAECGAMLGFQGPHTGQPQPLLQGWGLGSAPPHWGTGHPENL